MSSYLVLARKYRPSNFSEIVGQEVLVRTLSNSLKNNRLHHAYILHGIRGIGKTTTARIIAKSINCLDEDAIKRGDCCNVCENCRLISNSHHQDVVEIDAASQTKVEEMRSLLESVAYAPVSSRFKIYIIDEFHMLSNHSFNALLKTLEEPPAHVKFILATTEIRSVPQTILSRCQRFDLRRLDEEEIFMHLSNVLKKEGFEAEERALRIIAKSSEGSVRDSLSILDQALSNNNHQSFLPSEVVEKMLGFADCFKVIELFEMLLSGSFVQAQKAFIDIYQVSSDAVQIANDLLEIIYKVSCCKLVENYSLESFSKEQARQIREISQKIEISNLVRIWQLISKSIPQIKSSASHKMAFEMMMIRVCHLVSIPDLKNILLKLDEKNFESGLISSDSGFSNSFQSNFSKDSPSTISESNSNESDFDEENEMIGEILRSFEGSKIYSN